MYPYTLSLYNGSNKYSFIVIHCQNNLEQKLGRRELVIHELNYYFEVYVHFSINGTPDSR